jgi:GNAT superfamily N-acetyltransferase
MNCMAVDPVSFGLLTEAPRDQLLALLNDPRVRRHLIPHPLFTPESLEAWLRAKTELESDPLCRVRAVYVDAALAGWCGIQREGDVYDLGMILAVRRWGLGRQVFHALLAWGRALGHRELYALLPAGRPQRRALTRWLGQPVLRRTIQGIPFEGYRIALDAPSRVP